MILLTLGVYVGSRSGGGSRFRRVWMFISDWGCGFTLSFWGFKGTGGDIYARTT